MPSTDLSQATINFRELTARVGWSDAELSRRWRTGRREVPPNLLEWLRVYAEALDRLPRLDQELTRPRPTFLSLEKHSLR